MTRTKSAKKRMRAVIGNKCTGCGGSPICMVMCPVEGALEYVRDEDAIPFGKVRVNPDKCFGCGLCATKGYKGAITEGCPWQAVTLVPVAEEMEQNDARDPVRAFLEPPRSHPARAV